MYNNEYQNQRTLKIILKEQKKKMQKKVYGYARISSKVQNIERQIRNIKNECPNAIIVQEIFSGRKFQERKELQKLLKVVKNGDTIIFDSVSRMSRNAVDGFKLYKDLFLKGVNLVFIKEKHINTETYNNELKKQVNLTIDTGDTAANNLLNTVITALNNYILALAEKQIQLAFEQSEKEVKDLQQRTIEGIETARRKGKKIGGYRGTRKNKAPIQEIIKKYSRDFDGTLKDIDVIAIIKAKYTVARNTYYKYKKELKTV